jgi:hypothetical protein
VLIRFAFTKRRDAGKDAVDRTSPWAWRFVVAATPA